MLIMQYIFWSGFITLFYTYLGYGLIMFIVASFKKRKAPVIDNKDLPHVTMVIAAYNEAQFILDKVYNTMELDYPREKFEIIVVTDGSTDQTPELVKGFHWIRHFHSPERRGKIHAVNRVMNQVDTPIVVFSDANTMLNREAIKLMVRHYEDPSVGGVSGEKRILDKKADSAPGSGEGLYWKYESFLKKMDSEVYTMVGSAGELFSVRTDLYEHPPTNMVIEDFYISMSIVSKGYRFVYEPMAMATETASASVNDEWKRKVRISAGGIQAIVKLWPLLNFFKYGVISLQYISHRVLRWTLAPLALLVTFISNAALSLYGPSYFDILFLGQISFYFLAVLGYLFRNRPVSIKGFFVPFYFTVMNMSVFAGFKRFITRQQNVIWEKTERAMS